MRHNRGIPTEEVLAEMRDSEPPIYYLVGTPKSRLSKLEAELIGRPWEQVRPGLDVKLLAHQGELYVQAQSQDRVSKERAMRRRRLRKLDQSGAAEDMAYDRSRDLGADGKVAQALKGFQ